jgi:Tol biopolymer transport system component
MPDKPSPDQPISIVLLPIETGEKQRLTAPPGMSVDSDPAFSPDGRMLAFTRTASGVPVPFGIAELYVIPLSSSLAPAGAPKRLTFDNHLALSPTWTTRRQIIFASDRAGTGSLLWRIDVAGGAEPRRVESVGEDASVPAVSPKGDRLVYTRGSPGANIWRIELSPTKNQNNASDVKRSPLVTSSRRTNGARTSPDGSRIVFASNRSGAGEIWLSDASGQNVRKLTNLKAHSASPRWSSDASVVFDSTVDGHWDVYVISTDGGRPRRLTSGLGDSSAPSWSRDGQWIYYMSAREEDVEIWKTPVSGGKPVQVTRDGGFVPLEAPDGRFVYYLKKDSHSHLFTKTEQSDGLWRARADGGEEMRIFTDPVTYRAFDVLEDGIYYLSPGRSGETLLKFYEFSNKTSALLATIDKPVGNYLDFSPKRRWLLYTQQDEAAGDLMLVDGFR